MTIGNRLDAAMRDAGFHSQSDLSRASGVPQATISRILKEGDGVRGPAISTIRKLAKACNVTVDYLNEGGDKPVLSKAIPPNPNIELAILSQVIQLLTLYRASTPEAKDRIIDYAESEKKLPQLLRRTPASDKAK